MTEPSRAPENCPFCGKPPLTKMRNDVAIAWCGTVGCPLSLRQFRLHDEWNRRSATPASPAAADFAALLRRRAASKWETGDRAAAVECENCALAIEVFMADDFPPEGLCPRCKLRERHVIAWEAGGKTSLDYAKWCAECLADDTPALSPSSPREPSEAAKQTAWDTFYRIVGGAPSRQAFDESLAAAYAIDFPPSGGTT